jgi:hypothetical protein
MTARQTIRLMTMKNCAQCLAVVILLIGIVACSDDENSGPPVPGPETFTFFDLGCNSVLTEDVREALQDKLGNDAVEDRSLIDLEINYKGFINTYLPDVDGINRRLNNPPGERIDHKTTKLMYRYARKKGVPFDYIELLFCGYNRLPLVFEIRFKQDELNTVQTLEHKYGSPQTIEWDGGSGKTLIWHKDRDVLLVSMVPDQFDQPRYVVRIYFVENLEKLLDIEQKNKEARQTKRAQSGRRAF